MTRRWPAALLLSGLVVFAGLPLGLLLLRAVRSPSVAWWATWTAPDAIEALWGTVLTSAGAAVFAFVLGVPLELVAFSRDVRFVAFDRDAFVLAMGNTPWMLLVAYTVKYLAFGPRNASDALAQVNPSLAEAARIFGASPARAFVDATLPQLRGALGGRPSSSPSSSA
jgi:ABC-type Fe3+ transport system permease subunit